MKDDSIPTTIRIPMEILEILRAHGEKNDLTLSQVVRKALREFIRLSGLEARDAQN